MDEPQALVTVASVPSFVGASSIPTLVFTIVIAGILQERFALAPELFGALIIFTLVNTLVPGFVLRMPTPAYEAPEIPRSPRRPPSEAPGG